MDDEFRTTLVVDLTPDEIWERIAAHTIRGEDGDEHYILPGWPSLVQLPLPGASATPIEVEPGRLLRVEKDHEPCAGTEIALRLESAGKGTRMDVAQSGFGPFLDMVGRDVILTHGEQIARDFQLFLERRVIAPGTVWGPSLGARTRETPLGLEIVAVDAGGFAERAGLEAGDLLVALRGIRLHDTQQLQTVLALTEAGTPTEVQYARGRDARSSKASI